MYRYRNDLYPEDREIDQKLTKYQPLLAKWVHLLSFIDNFFWLIAVYWTGQKTVLKENKLRQDLDVLFLMSISRKYPGFKMSFEHNSARKNLFLSANFCWESRLSLREVDQKLIFGGTFGYADSYLDFSWRHSEN